jgi:hypothetical protein
VLLDGGERDQLGAVGRWPYIASHAAISNASDATSVALARAKSSAAYGACRVGREEAAGGQLSGTALPGPDYATDGKQRGNSGAGDAYFADGDPAAAVDAAFDKAVDEIAAKLGWFDAIRLIEVARTVPPDGARRRDASHCGGGCRVPGTAGAGRSLRPGKIRRRLVPPQSRSRR